MHLSYTEDQQLLRDSVRRTLEKHLGLERRRQLAGSDDGHGRELWSALAELGALGAELPESCGGLDGSPTDTLVVMEELGRGLSLEPYLSTVVLCAGLLRDAGTPAQQQARLPEIVRGARRMALAVHEPGARHAWQQVATRAVPDGDGQRLSGRKSVVLDGPLADELIVSARSSGAGCDAAGVSLYLVSPGAPGVTLRGYASQDGRRAAELELSDVQVGPEALLGPAGGGQALLERAIERGIAALCGEAVGIMDALDAATLTQLKTRKQFGVEIGRFQVLQHRLADMVIATEEARSMALLAALALGSDDAAERQRTLSAAKALVNRSARFVGQEAVQLHGGMGMSEELVVSHLFKRLTAIQLTFGDTDHHLARFGASLA